MSGYKFNESLLDSISQDKKTLAKLVLFAIAEDLPIQHSIIASDKPKQTDPISWRDTILADMQQIVIDLHREEIIHESYEPKHVRYILNKPLYISNKFEAKLLTPVWILKVRKLFMKRYCKVDDRNADKDTVTKHLDIFFRNNPGATTNQVYTAIKYMIDNRVADDPARVPNILNFINAYGDESKKSKDLAIYVEQIQDMLEDSNNSLETISQTTNPNEQRLR